MPIMAHERSYTIADNAVDAVLCQSDDAGRQVVDRPANIFTAVSCLGSITSVVRRSGV